MSKLFVSEHPLIQSKMAMLRDAETGAKEFREIIGEVAMLLSYEATRDLPLKEVQVQTPVEDVYKRQHPHRHTYPCGTVQRRQTERSGNLRF